MPTWINCYWDYTEVKQLLYKDYVFDAAYIKMSLKSINDDFQTINANSKTVELIDINEENVGMYVFLERLIDKLGVNRLVLNFKITCVDDLKPNRGVYSIFNVLEKLNFQNVAVNLHFSHQDKLEGSHIEGFLMALPIIKHFTSEISEDSSGFYIKNVFNGFYRYHKFRWSKHNYHDEFDLSALLDMNVLCLGKKAISRDKYDFYQFVGIEKGDKEWGLQKIKYLPIEDVQKNDALDRLCYYYELLDSELNDSFSILKKWKYRELVEYYKGKIFSAHEDLIDLKFQHIFRKSCLYV